jgi:hypothetical protein
MPAEQVDAMVAARGRSTRDVVGRVLSMLDERPDVSSFSVSQGGTRSPSSGRHGERRCQPGRGPRMGLRRLTAASCARPALAAPAACRFPGAVELGGCAEGGRTASGARTNASASPPARYAAHLRALGFDVADEEFVTAGSAAADHVRHHPRARVLALGGDGLTAPMADAGVAVVEPGEESTADVGSGRAAEAYSAAALNAACLAVDAGAPLYVTVRTPWFHGGLDKSVSVSSAVAAAISWVTGVEPQVTGKPSPALAERLLARSAPPRRPSTSSSSATTPQRSSWRARWGRPACSSPSGATTREGLATFSADVAPDLAFPDIATVHDLVRPPSLTASRTPQ